MTFADDFATEEQSLEGDYPSAFGITFTPTILGLAIAVAGIALAGYGFINYVKPAQEKYSQASIKKEELQGQLNKIKTGDLQLKLAQLQSDLAAQQVLKSRVLSMFTSEQDLDTLLIDVDSFIAVNQANLIQYQPDSNASTIDDASLGSEVQGKLKRKGISLTIEGTFTETKQILQDLERLQPLLMIQSISSTVDEQPTAIFASNNTEILPKKQAELKTQIKLDAILPSSEAELERAKKADEQAEMEESSKRKSRRKNREK
ncbi:type II and III secretion system protein [Waterburya agarophytonicola K14]|uniref:Type II and III secretion system protein n=1 Tax=Waterburya agarophytonicola KI4 TaxID=2874699 RepID=A0A964FH83_9CYAN|nr:type II and III secretion system protein [Waterburya agarophytonicola]MCC0177374.1 type II and III secretion system protein [Waterburya agarophytonicola KI4]